MYSLYIISVIVPIIISPINYPIGPLLLAMELSMISPKSIFFTISVCLNHHLLLLILLNLLSNKIKVLKKVLALETVDKIWSSLGHWLKPLITKIQVQAHIRFPIQEADAIILWKEKENNPNHKIPQVQEIVIFILYQIKLNLL